jgi:hypothetical protein
MGKATKTTGGQMTADRELSREATSAALRLTPYLDRGARGERFGVELSIGPEEAEFLLAFNPSNRNLRPTKIAQFVKDMRHGRWMFNGEPIIVASTGELNDGQHRLQAIMQTKIPQNMAVWFGVPRETRHTIDSGAARTAGEHLTMAGVPYGTNLAAAAKLIISYEEARGRSMGRTSSVTSLQQQERAKTDELLQEVVQYCEHHRAPFIRTTLVSTAFYILSRVSPLEAKNFIDGILTGIGLNANDPAYLVRERLMRAWSNRTAAGKPRMTDTEMMETIFRGWNYFATGRTDAQKLQVMGSFPALRQPHSAPVSRVQEVAEEAISNNTGDTLVPYPVEVEPAEAA